MLSNAIKYSSKKENPSIEIESYDNGNQVIYSIRDNGAGFDDDYAHKLLGPALFCSEPRIPGKYQTNRKFYLFKMPDVAGFKNQIITGPRNIPVVFRKTAKLAWRQ
ncbi:MAG: hypothetical protein IPG90_18935 [Bacteroidetes bacterium]|nr:hypothetical protein [Bacteroidota bacterium]